ncbi:MAG TPA: GNAT family N-acetyltransferase [Gemmatimonadaceae bacterium]|nr:GNAT family N-acetyltransferase [Gemmatimonadaceae bacterium]
MSIKPYDTLSRCLHAVTNVKTSIVVRDARPSDSDAAARLCTQLGYPADADAIAERLVRLATDSNARAYVAVNDDGRVVGLETVHLRITLNHAAPLAQITLLVVDEACRGQGVGQRLVGAAEHWAREHGCSRIVVTTALDRAGAHRFYERAGYSHTGRRYLKDFRPE